MKTTFGTLLFLIAFALPGQLSFSQNQALSRTVSATAMDLWKDSLAAEGKPDKWNYEQGVLLKGIEDVWYNTGDARYFSYIQRVTDKFIGPDGTIRTYKAEDYNLDNIAAGRNLLMLYKVTGQDKYRIAAETLRNQLKNQPRTPEGGFWHKKVYPNQMWLDGLYMAEPFYAEYAATFHEDADFDDIAKQFILMEKQSRDSATGLLYHGWDSSKKERWADPATGHSPNFWSRAMGWYAVALVDTLDYFPVNNTQRPELVAILMRLASSIQKYQDPKTGLWFDITDKAAASGNYPESSASSMFVYALAKGARKGYLPASALDAAKRGWEGIGKQFIQPVDASHANLTGTVSVSGLGGNPYRDGSYKYYMSEKVVTNDPKGIGAFLMAASEMENVPTESLGKGRTVKLDYYFNAETKKDSTGRMMPFHYKWEEMPNSGYSLWGHIFNKYGMNTEPLEGPPTSADLKGTAIYIIVDPDTPEETPNPHYIEQPHIKAITDWVKAGGVLVLMGNDAGNMEFDHLNQLAGQFGIQFNKDSKNRVEGNKFSMGAVPISPGNPIFTTARNPYLKEISTLKLSGPAKPVVNLNGDVVMAVSKVGKGTVFAVGDPWFYNEYLDGRKLPAEFDNYAAAEDLTKWLIKQVPARALSRY